jgi:succinoglycan biosynthesis protein ExoA
MPLDNSNQRQPAPARSTEAVRRISIIIPMFNEADHIEHLVADIAAQDFSGAVEVVVADGASTDDSVQKLTEAAERAGLELHVLPNPARYVSHGLNACIRRATGDLLVRLDCHTFYPPDHLRLYAEAAVRTGAWNIGGKVIPMGRTAMERAVSSAMDGPFGGVHWNRLAAGSQTVDVDVVHCGAYRPEGFERAGLFDESLVRNQDDDLAFRLRQAGGRVVLDPTIRSHYVPRGSLRGVFRQYYEYGFWKAVLMRKHRQVISGRSLAPLAFFGTCAILAIASVWSSEARAVLAIAVGGYVLGAAIFALMSLRRRKESLRLLPRVLAVFPAFHVSYALGMLWGFARSVRRLPVATTGEHPATS